MKETRILLIVAWLVVAWLAWQAWQADHRVAQPLAGAISGTRGGSTEVPRAAVKTAPGTESASTVPNIPLDPGTATVAAESQIAAGEVIATISNGLIEVDIDSRGGTLRAARLQNYPSAKPGGPVSLLAGQGADYFVAQQGLLAVKGALPSHEARFELVDQRADAVTLRWGDADVTVERTIAMPADGYAIEASDRISNRGATVIEARPYRQLVRTAALNGPSFMNPESYSFVGAAWYSPDATFNKRDFDDFEPGSELSLDTVGGWIGMLQHYFVVAWIPAAEETQHFETAKVGDQYLVRAIGAPLRVEPGQSVRTSARLYAGPKLQDELNEVAPGLGLSLDYGVLTILAEPMYVVLSWLHGITGNWGFAIILLVVLIKAALFKLSEAQYKSFAKMRAIQPRLESLKERYGDDRQKFQMAMLELYKKEKINPAAGCLPILVQLPIFLSLYWVLLESVELRQANWLWVPDLSAPDPLFILPIVNLAAMWLTQKLTPMTGMDPMQRKMMQVLPLVFGVAFAFFPAGLVLYWATNGLLGLAQQTYITRRHGGAVVKR